MTDTIPASQRVPPRLEKPVLYLVVPCYNEEEVLPESSSVFSEVLKSLIADNMVDAASRILFVNDGSCDGTWSCICALHKRYPTIFTGIKLSHNQGHQNALIAGLMSARARGCDVVVSLDVDLQDDPYVIADMLKAYRSGAEIVYGVRSDRGSDSLFKRGSARLFYRFMKYLGTETIPDCADFRLMGKAALDALAQYKEVNLFLRGIVPSLGFSTATVTYVRGPRRAGLSKYSRTKMVSFAVDGITSFSIRPIRMIVVLGILAVVISCIMFVYVLASVLTGHVVLGWTSLIASIWFVGGAVMLSLGVVGEYIGRIYLETKRRPRYIVEEALD